MLGRFTEDLTALQRMVRCGDGDGLFDLFTRTRAIRRGIIGKARRRRRLISAAGRGRAISAGRSCEGDAAQSPRDLAANRFCLARLPQISISHQRRLLFFVASKNNQPHLSPWHCLTRVRSACCNSVSAESRIGRRRTRPGFARRSRSNQSCRRQGSAGRRRARARALWSASRRIRRERDGWRRGLRRGDRASRATPARRRTAAPRAAHPAPAGVQAFSLVKRDDLGVRRPIDDLCGSAQVLTMSLRSAPGAGVGEIQRQLAADEGERPGAG